MEAASVTLRPGVGELEYRCRDIGYGVEEDIGEYVYRGVGEAGAPHVFEPRHGGRPIYLFGDEIVSWHEFDPVTLADKLRAGVYVVLLVATILGLIAAAVIGVR